MTTAPVPVPDLVPCPFCGGRPELVAGERYNDDEQLHFVRCLQCAAEGPWAKSAGGARRWWNKREPLPSTHEEKP